MSAFRELADKVAVVTGGASGIGLGIARQFRAAGMSVVIADIEDTALQQAAEQLGATGVRTDVRDPASVQALADATVDRYGAVHVVVNNAGVGPMAPIAALELSDWQWLLEVNLWGVIHGVHTFLPLLKQNPDGGHIVNTASIGGLVTGPGMGAYNVSKFGIVALTEVLATELSAEGSAVGASVLLPRHGAHQHRQQHAEPAGRRVRRCVADSRLEDGPDLGMRWLEPDDVGRILIASMAAGDLYVVTHPEGWPMVQGRHEAIADAFQAASGRT